MGDVHIFLTAEGRLLQGQGQTGPHGAPFGRSCPGLSAPAEPAKAAAEEGAKQVAHVKSAEPASPAGTTGAKIGVHPRKAKLIVLGPLLLVREHLIGLIDLFEPGFRRFVARVQVRVILFGQLPVSFFQFIVRGAFLDPQDLIVISFLLVCHWFLTSQ